MIRSAARPACAVTEVEVRSEPVVSGGNARTLIVRRFEDGSVSIMDPAALCKIATVDG